MDKGMLDRLLLHTGTLGSIYHKNPETFIRTARPRYLPDSPALNSSSRRHLVKPHTSSSMAARAVKMPTIPPRTAESNGDANGTTQRQESTGTPPPVSDDIYAQLAGIDLLGGGGAYQTDMPRPQRGQTTDDFLI